ncbi:MAG: DUF11 domain-containing protein [Verrucomicrobiaceae bacterium]|nr:DUF11 domain-containing protein [Verrucomicrobiaceae bacterium]
MKTYLTLILIALTSFVSAVDTTPPTLDITHTWIERAGTRSNFKMLLDPQDETGLAMDAIVFRSALNTSTIPASNPWQWMPWKRGEPFVLGFTCTSCVIEIRARDAARNLSPVQKRFFQAPFPYSTKVNLVPTVTAGESYSGSAASVRGLFIGRFDGVGTGDDLVQVDRATGNIMVRRQINGQPTKSDVSFTLPANTIEDSASADFDTDSRADLAIVAGGALTVYHNDGLDGSGVVQFGAQTINTAGTGITIFKNIAVGDVNGDGKLDIIVTGEDGSANPRVGWLIANASWQYDSSNGVPAPPGTTPGKVAVGDMNGDGKLDVVAVDAANNQMIVFKNKGTVLAGDGEVDANYQPQTIATGLGNGSMNDPTIPLISAPVKALTIGDVTGDGRPDIITVFSEILYTNPLDSNDGRTQQHWRLYENRGTSGIRPHTTVMLGQSPVSQMTLEEFPSDVMLMEMTNDRFPEMLFTNYYDNSVKIIRFTPLLDTANFLTTLDDGTGVPELDEINYKPLLPPGESGPSRLAKGKYRSSSEVNSIAIAFGGSDTSRWDLVSYKPKNTGQLAIIGGATTTNDPDGSEGANDQLEYFAYPTATIDYSLTVINNTANPLNNAVFDALLPKEVTITDNGGGTEVPSGTSKFLRWTETLPGLSVVTKTFKVTINSTAKPVIVIRPKLTAKAGAFTGSDYMPKVTVDEPISFDLVSVQSDTDITGRTAHFGEYITYRMKVTNKGHQTITDTKVGMSSTPAGSKIDGGSVNDPETPSTFSPGESKIEFNVLSLAPGANKEVFVNVEVREKPPGTVINKSMYALRPAGRKRTLPAVETEIRPSLKVIASSNKPNGASPGEEIEYTLVVENCSVNDATSCRVVSLIPPGTNLVSARANDGSGNFIDSPQPIVGLTETSSPAYFYDTGKLTRLLQWNLGTIPGAPLRSGLRPRRTLMFTVRVGTDTPTFWTPGGVQTPINANLDNFNVVYSSGKTFFAYPRRSDGSIINPFNLLPKEAADGTAVEINNSNPQPEPSLQLTKTVRGQRNYSLPEVPADGDPNTVVYPVQPREPGAGDTPFNVLKNGSITYCLHYSNYGNVAATNVKVHDYIPSGMIFQGFVAKDRKLVESLAFSRFYDGDGGILPRGTETYTDSNGNFAFDPGEPFTDINGNGLLDELAPDIRKIRSFDLHAGTVPAGESHRFFYQAQCTLDVGGTATSLWGGVNGVTNGLFYTYYNGYYLNCDELYFPVSGGPEAVVVKVVKPAVGQFIRPYGHVGAAAAIADPPPSFSPLKTRHSRSISKTNLSATASFCAAMPVDIQGNGAFSNLEVTMDIPVGYIVQDAVVKDKAGANVVNWKPNPTPAEKLTHVTPDNPPNKPGGKGPCRITFPLGTRTFCWPIVKLGFDPDVLADPAPNALQDEYGHTKEPLIIKCNMMGTNLTKTSSQIKIDTISNSEADGKVFVGRAARMSVTKEDQITYVIFWGNLTDNAEVSGRVEMKVPEGCDYVSSTKRISNYILTPPLDLNEFGNFTGDYDPNTRKVTWSIPLLNGSEGGAVTLTVKVRKDFAGSRIDDDSCRLTVGNLKTFIKSPGPLAVAIRTGDVDTQSSEITQRWLQGGLVKNNDAIVSTLKTNFALNEKSHGITIGGADYLQLQNGIIIIPLGGNRAMVLDDNTKGIVSNSETIVRVLAQTSGFRVFAGPGAPNGFQLVNPPGYPSQHVHVNKILRDLDVPADSLIRKGLADVICCRGLNLIQPGSADFTDFPILSSNPKFVIPGPDPALPAWFTAPVANMGGLLINPNAPRVVKGNRAGSAMLAGPTPGTPGAVLAGGAAGLIGQDGAALIGQDGAAVVSSDGAGVVSSDGAGLIGQDGAALIGQDGAAIVAGGGGNIVAGGGGNIVAGGGGNIVAGGGGNIVAAGGGN